MSVGAVSGQRNDNMLQGLLEPYYRDYTYVRLANPN